MDVDYLLILQNLREALGGNLDEFFNAISKVSVGIMMLLPCVIYWSVDKKWGWRFLAARWLGEVVNGLVKLTVCAYRPWIRSPLIEPAGDSKTAATGYSFPSGHTMCAVATYGTTAVWQYKKRKWLSILCCVMILLTMFSRNFLGVHTPQDVIVGFLETALLIFLILTVEKRVAGNDRRLDLLSIAGLVLIAGAIVYILVKPYPMDYTADGQLLVDPAKMMKDTFNGCGGVLGLIVGGYLERRFIRYEIPVGHRNLPILTCVGAGVFFAWTEYFESATVHLIFGRNWGNFVGGFISVMFVVVLFPLVIRKYCGNDAESALPDAVPESAAETAK